MPTPSKPCGLHCRLPWGMILWRRRGLWSVSQSVLSSFYKIKWRKWWRLLKNSKRHKQKEFVLALKLERVKGAALREPVLNTYRDLAEDVTVLLQSLKTDWRDKKNYAFWHKTCSLRELKPSCDVHLKTLQKLLMYLRGIKRECDYLLLEKFPLQTKMKGSMRIKLLCSTRSLTCRRLGGLVRRPAGNRQRTRDNHKSERWI